MKTAEPSRTAPLSFAAVVATVFAVLYAVSIGPARENLTWYNFIFDADPARVMRDVAEGQDPFTWERHPLLGLIVAAPARVAGAIGVPNPAWLVVAIFGGIGAGLAFLLFRRIGGDDRSALLWTVIYGCAAPIWLLSSIPETFALNSAFLIGLFLIRDPSYADPTQRKRIAAATLLSAGAVGISVPNAMYVAIANAWNAFEQPRRKIRQLLILAGLGLVTFGALGVLQRAAGLQPRVSASVLATPVTAAARDQFLHFGRDLSIAEVAGTARMFIIDPFVPAPPSVKIISGPDGPLQMIQSGSRDVLSLAALALVVLGFAVVAARARWREVWTSKYVRFALAALGFNLVFHLFYRANGEPFIFTAHTVIPVLAILAAVQGGSAFRWRNAVLSAVTVVAVTSNGRFMSGVRAATAAPCEVRVGNVCTRWLHADDGERYSEGLSGFLASADYPFEQGRVAAERGALAEAVPHFERAIAIDGRHALAHRYLGATLLKLHRPGGPEHLRIAVDLNPRDEISRQLLARLPVP